MPLLHEAPGSWSLRGLLPRFSALRTVTEPLSSVVGTATEAMETPSLRHSGCMNSSSSSNTFSKYSPG